MVPIKNKTAVKRRKEKGKNGQNRFLRWTFILVIFKLGKPKVKKLTNKLRSSSALCSLGSGPAATPRGGHLWLHQHPCQGWPRGGKEMPHIPLAVFSHWLRKYVCVTQLVASLPLSGRPRVQVPPQNLGSFPKAMLALSWKVDGGMHWKRKLFLLGSSREMGIRGARVTTHHISLIHKFQWTPVWHWHNYNPVAGTSKRRGNIGFPAPPSP